MLNLIKNYFRPVEPKAIVLMYHRVCEIDTDPWQLAVSTENFESQIRMLTEKFTVLPINDLNKQLTNTKLINNSVYITFDDAYNDIYLNAKPILEKYACPATFFVPTHFIGKYQQFWWDELEAIFLHSKELPSNLTLNFTDECITFNFKAETLTDHVIQKHKSWKYPDPPPTNRCHLYLKIWEHLKPLPHHSILAVINEIKIWADFDPASLAENIPMSSRQLKELSDNKLFSLGLHTQTHLALANHSQAIQNEEIVGCRDYLEKNNYPAISAIAYPYGSYNANTLSVIALNKIALGFTTSPITITRNSTACSLGRYQVANYNGSELKDNLSYWFDKN